jgi:hypothetical protein
VIANAPDSTLHERWDKLNENQPTQNAHDGSDTAHDGEQLSQGPLRFHGLSDTGETRQVPEGSLISKNPFSRVS